MTTDTTGRYAPMPKPERDQLRAAQAEAVMPLIGPLLDAWQCGSQTCREELPELDKQLRLINRAMEDADATHALRAAQRPQADAEWLKELERLAVRYGNSCTAMGEDWSRVREETVQANRAALMDHAAQRPVCQTCGGIGLIGGHSGQTPESYQEHSEDCPDCTPQRPGEPTLIAVETAGAGSIYSAGDAAAQDDRAAFEEWFDGEYLELARIVGDGVAASIRNASRNAWQAALASRPVPPPVSEAMSDVAAERLRQIEVEGWTPEHDDANHFPDELALAASCYCVADEGEAPSAIWPWHAIWWKPKDQRRNMVRAAALLLAAIELHDRIAARDAQWKGGV